MIPRNNPRSHTCLKLAAFCTLFPAAHAAAQTPLSSAFTYQGDLTELGVPANGPHDLRFRLYSAATGGVQIGSTLCVNNSEVVGGQFATILDFGAVFSGQQRFLEIDVRADTGLDCGDSTGSGYVTLSPRQALTAAPNAAYSLTAGNAATLNGQLPGYFTNAANLTGTVPGAALSGAYSGAVNLSNTSNIFAGNGSALSALNANSIAAGTLADSRLSGNIVMLNRANAFQAFTNTFGGPVGIGVGNPVSPLQIAGTGPLLTIGSGTFQSGHTQLILGTTALAAGKGTIQAIGQSGASYGDLLLNAAGGNVGVAVSTVNPVYKFQVGGDAQIAGKLSSTGNLEVGGNAGVTGNVGVGTTNPSSRLQVVAPASLSMFTLGSTDFGRTALVMGLSADTAGAGQIQAVSANGGSWGDIMLNPYGGGVIIGSAATAQASLSVTGFKPRVLVPQAGVFMGVEDGIRGVLEINANDGADPAIEFTSGSGSYYGGDYDVRMVYNHARNTIDFYGQSLVSVNQLEIRGGADLAEPFDIAAESADQVVPGMLVCIDPENPGKLRLSSAAYDATVAGVVSGAGGVNAGISMKQAGTRADGQHAVALSGRVYCYVDADADGAIRPGDMLTTSPTPGHAMKALDPDRSRGAVIGKAMTSLDHGKGLVLVLVSLQ